MRGKAILLQVVGLTILVGVGGCFSSHPKDIEAFIMPHEVIVTAERYLLQPPDEIEVHCTKVPEIHLQRQRIRPDGKVGFEALGEFEAAGKTPEELASELQEKVVRLYTLVGDKPIEVRLIAYQSKVYYVLGQVYLPGPKVYTGRDSVLSALAMAQPNPMAWLQRIQVIRPSGDKNIKPKIFEVDFDRMAAHGDTRKDVLLQEGDIIYVPPTVLAAIGMKIEEIIRPIARAFAGAYIVQGGGDRYVGGYGGGGGSYR
ncbi:MAG: polysaccharide biosynthesis/export family protein [Planctomycetota bacterium]